MRTQEREGGVCIGVCGENGSETSPQFEKIDAKTKSTGQVAGLGSFHGSEASKVSTLSLIMWTVFTVSGLPKVDGFRAVDRVATLSPVDCV